MAPSRHDIWSGPIIGYGDASSMSAGGRFEHPGDFEYDPHAENAKKGARGRGSSNKNSMVKKRSRANSSMSEGDKAARADNYCRSKISTLKRQLAKAERDKIARADASKRLRYLQTCLMRLTLTLSTYTGDAEGYLTIVANFPFDEDHIITREPRCVTVKNYSSKQLCLKAIASDNKLTIGLSGGNNYWVHMVEANGCDEYIGKTWHIMDLW